MADAGAKQVGKIGLRAIPITDDFRKELQAKLKIAIKGVKVEIPVELDSDHIRAEAKAAAKEASKEKVKIKVEAEDGGVVRETRRLRALAQKLVGSIKTLVTVNIPASIAAIKAEMKIIEKVVQGYRISVPLDLVGMGKWLGIVTAVSGGLLAIPHILAAIGGAAQVVGGVFALLPGLVAGFAAGIAALVVGTKGFFEALGNSGDVAAFEESLKKLTPAAQESARALAEFRKPLGEIREAVQEELFKGMKDEFLKLKGLLPPIKTGLTGISGGIRDMAKDWIRMATSQKSIEDTGTILDNIKKGFQSARPAAANFGAALRDMTVVGTGFAQELGKSLAGVSQRFADWAAKARETGEMQRWIANALDKLKQMGRVLKNIVDIFKNLTKGLKDGLGEDFGDMMERLTTSFKNFTGSEEFQKSLKSLGRVLREVIDIGTEVFKKLFSGIGQVLREAEPFLLSFARGIGALISGALDILVPLLKGMFHWLSENKAIMAPLVATLVAMVTAFKLAVTVAKGISAIKGSFEALKAGATIIGDVGGSIVGATKKIIVGLKTAVVETAKATARFVYSWGVIALEATKSAAKTFAAWVVSAAKSAAFTGRYYAIMAAQAIANFVRMAVTATINAAKIAATWIAQTTMMVARVIAQMAIAVAAWVANWIRMAAVATANAIRMAAAWIIAMGPIAWVIAAIIALVALIVLNWDAIWAATVSVWNAIWKFVSDIITAVVDWFVAGWNQVLDFIRAVPGWIRSGLATLWDILTWPFRQAWQIISDLWGAIGDWFGKIPGWIRSALSSVWDALTWPFRKAWEFITGIVDKIKNAIGSVVDWVGGLFSDHGEFDASVNVPVTFTAGKMPKLTTGYEPFSFEEYADFGSMNDVGSLEASARKVSVGLTQAQSTPASSGMDNIAQQIEQALSSWTVEIDANGIAKLVNKANLKNRRRG